MEISLQNLPAFSFKIIYSFDVMVYESYRPVSDVYMRNVARAGCEAEKHATKFLYSLAERELA